MIKKIFNKLIYGYRSDSASYLTYLRKAGASIGNDVNIFSSKKTNIDILNPHLLTIGNHVNIVASTILTHDYAWCVIKGLTGEILGNQRPVTIGNNVFVGEGSIIMGGTIIEDNVIIGAHSVVSGRIYGNSVYAGNPAKLIMSIDEYIDKRREKQLNEAKVFCLKYKDAHGSFPDIDKLHEYFFLFSNDKSKLTSVFDDKLKLCGNYELSVAALEKHNPTYSSYEDFLNDIQ